VESLLVDQLESEDSGLGLAAARRPVLRLLLDAPLLHPELLLLLLLFRKELLFSVENFLNFTVVSSRSIDLFKSPSASVKN